MLLQHLLTFFLTLRIRARLRGCCCCYFLPATTTLALTFFFFSLLLILLFAVYLILLAWPFLKVPLLKPFMVCLIFVFQFYWWWYIWWYQVKNNPNFKINITKIIIGTTTPKIVSPSSYLYIYIYIYIRGYGWRNGHWIWLIEPNRRSNILYDMSDGAKNQTKIWLLKIATNNNVYWILQGYFNNNNE